MKDNREEYVVDFKLEFWYSKKKMTNFIYRNQEFLLNKEQYKLEGKSLTLEKIFVAHTTDKDWFPNIYKELLKVTRKS